jgi:hypothetical protein
MEKEGTEKKQQKKPVKLKNEGTNPFMLETDSKNPYGPNYEGLPLESKIYYKYARVKKFVHFADEDSKMVIDTDMKWLLGIFCYVSAGAISSIFLKNLVAKRSSKRIFELLDTYSTLYYGVAVAQAFTSGYFALNSYYVKTVCNPMIDKYLKQAIDNGFEDYEISQ